MRSVLIKTALKSGWTINLIFFRGLIGLLVVLLLVDPRSTIPSKINSSTNRRILINFKRFITVSQLHCFTRNKMYNPNSTPTLYDFINKCVNWLPFIKSITPFSFRSYVWSISISNSRISGASPLDPTLQAINYWGPGIPAETN